MLYYVVRRRLGMSVTEWQNLVWWEAELLKEGLMEEAKANHLDSGASHNGQNSGRKPIDVTNLTQSELKDSVGGFQFRSVG